MKKLLSMILFVTFISNYATLVLAEDTTYTQPCYDYIDFLEEEGLEYIYVGIPEGMKYELLTVPINSSVLGLIQPTLAYTLEGDAVSIYHWNLITFAPDNAVDVILVCNQFNSDYRFIKFNVDLSNYSVNVRLDLALDAIFIADENVHNHLISMVSIMENAYGILEQYQSTASKSDTTSLLGHLGSEYDALE